MSKIRYYITVCVLGTIVFVSIINIARASPRTSGTVVPGGNIGQDIVWTKEGSPYLLSGQVQLSGGHILTIGPGVRVALNDRHEDYTGIAISGGSLKINGTREERVSIENIGTISISSGSADISFADIMAQGPLYLLKSSANISSSTFASSTGAGILLWDGKANVEGSSIRDNVSGIVIFEDFDSDHSSLTIRNSKIISNSKYAIMNQGSRTVEAQNNWWGSPLGPSTSVGIDSNTITGPVSYKPWLTADPDTIIATSTVCCSSILFIPGLEGTRLYTSASSLNKLLSSTNRLWEPNRNADVEKLYLNSDGTSVDLNIYSGDPIDSVFGLKGIYGRFVEYLDELRNKGTIDEWKAFGYDWRKPITEVVAGTENKAATVESLQEIVSELAKRSKTGKVTLITHSNGGLVGKLLVKTLVDQGKQNLIDSVISVAVPFLGTPESIVALLHGGHQSILGGLVLNESVARGLGQNMASAYSLLPSKEYFKKVFSPTIVFASTTIAGVNDGSYPLEINSFEDQNGFIADIKNIRQIPTFNDTSIPIIGNVLLSSAADILHGILDPFSWPATITRYAILGWNVPTTRGISYNQKKFCWRDILGMSCSEKVVHEALDTVMGDGTVIAPSAADNSEITLSIDLEKVSSDENRNIRHSNILESSTTESLITRVISKADQSDKSQLPPGVSWGEPDYTKEPISIVLSTHSPVDLHIYDEKGNHTGLISKPEELIDNDFVNAAYETNIPGSNFRISEGIDGTDTSITLKNDNVQSYDVVIDGNAIGFATFDIKKMEGAKVLESVEYSMFPVTPLTVATTSAFSGFLPQKLAIDIDGNGSPDIVNYPNPGQMPDPSLSGQSLRMTLEAIIGNDPRAKSLLARLDHILELVKQNRTSQSKRQASQLQKRLGHIKLDNISESDRKKLLDAIEQLIIAIE